MERLPLDIVRIIINLLYADYSGVADVVYFLSSCKAFLTVPFGQWEAGMRSCRTMAGTIGHVFWSL